MDYEIVIPQTVSLTALYMTEGYPSPKMVAFPWPFPMVLATGSWWHLINIFGRPLAMRGRTTGYSPTGYSPRTFTFPCRYHKLWSQAQTSLPTWGFHHGDSGTMFRRPLDSPHMGKQRNGLGQHHLTMVVCVSR